MSNTRPTRLKILVVDDERIIADTLTSILNHDGFEAIAAYGGLEAIARANSEPFDVVLTDVVMPDMNGIKASEEICKLWPQCKVILVSGNIATAHLLREVQESGKDFEIFAKPVHPLTILERLHAIARELSRPEIV